MRRIMPYLIAVLLAGASGAAAQQTVIPEVEGPLPPAAEPVEPAAPPEALEKRTDENRLDKLFAELKRERNEKAAERIANFIREEWTKSGSATIDLLMQWSGKAMQEKKFDAALDFLDQVTMIAPDFAEGWNRRATVHYMMDSYAKSMSDIEHTLRLEPRHFGALSGMAEIFRLYDRKQAALDAYTRVLRIYPMLRSAQEQVGNLADELAGEGI
jgi:tetratricopeptide (TPR) repeat protein